jgi:hypothetical protein
MKICQMGAKLDGQTEMMNLIVAFHNFAKAPNGICVTSNKVWHLLMTFFILWFIL